MGEFLPYAGANSVQEVVVGVRFQHSRGLENVDRLMTVAKSELTEFNQFDLIYPLDISVDISRIGNNVSQVTPPNSASGFEFSRLGHDGKLEQAIRYARGVLTAHFAKYNGWENVLPTSLRYLKQLVLEKVDLKANPVTVISLRFIDTYTYTGDKDESCAQFLFKRNAPYIVANCFETKGAWHSNTGWFEAAPGGGKILNQLNIANRIAGENAVVTVDHDGTVDLKSPRKSLQEIDGDSVPETGLEGILNALHSGNKRILQNILLDDMLQRIGVVT